MLQQYSSNNPPKSRGRHFDISHSASKMKSTLALAMAAVAAAQSPIPPAEFNLPMAENNTQLGVAFNQMNGGQSVVVQPGSLFGKGGKYLI